MKITFYLDTRQTERLHPLKLALAEGGKTTYISLGHSIEKSHWDKKMQQVIKRTDRASINMDITEKKILVDRFIREKRLEGMLVGIPLSSLRDIVNESLFCKKGSDKRTISYLFSELSKGKEESTQRSYDDALKKLKEFDSKVESYDISLFTRDYIISFWEFMKNDELKSNTISTYMSKIKAATNYAIDEDIIQKDPFRKIVFKKDVTRHRALTKEAFLNLISSPKKKGEKIAIDIFILTFLLIGINPVDLYAISSNDVIKDGKIRYQRKKTGKYIEFNIPPEAIPVIERLKGKEHWLMLCEKWKQKRTMMTFVDSNIKRVCKRIGMERISIYWARHTWSTLAHEAGVQKDDISLSLTHSSGKSVTDVYIKYDYTRVDAANRKVIDYVFGTNKEHQE